MTHQFTFPMVMFEWMTQHIPSSWKSILKLPKLTLFVKEFRCLSVWGLGPSALSLLFLIIWRKGVQHSARSSSFQMGIFSPFVSAVRSALGLAAVDSSLYARHSFRIGAATTAAQRVIPDSLIKALGRWQSSAYTIYIRTPRETLCSVAQRLVGPGGVLQ